MTDNEILVHHGIKGQKWGVRRFQNEDGTRTSAGKARDAQRLENAAKAANNAAKNAKENAKYYRDSYEQFRKKYEGENGTKKYLQDSYGNVWKDKARMKELYDVDDAEEHAKKEIASESKYRKELSSQMSDLYIKEAKAWEAKAKKYMETTSMKDLDKKEIKEVKKLANEYMRQEKRNNKNSIRKR